MIRVMLISMDPRVSLLSVIVESARLSADFTAFLPVLCISLTPFLCSYIILTEP